MHPHEIEEMEYRDAPKLWDADPDVCCAAFQTGACVHTEAMTEEDIAELLEASEEADEEEDWRDRTDIVRPHYEALGRRPRLIEEPF